MNNGKSFLLGELSVEFDFGFMVVELLHDFSLMSTGIEVIGVHSGLFL